MALNDDRRHILLVLLLSVICCYVLYGSSVKWRITRDSNMAKFLYKKHSQDYKHNSRHSKSKVMHYYRGAKTQTGQKQQAKDSPINQLQTKQVSKKQNTNDSPINQTKDSPINQTKDSPIKQQSPKNDTATKRPVKRRPPGEKCKRHLPSAIVIGIQKCGTTALLYFLNYHPQVAAALHPQEVKFFSVYYAKGLEWYRQQMECSYSNQVTMEKSPPYFYRSSCADRIKKMNPKTKLILIVKDPITRTQSAYAMLIRSQNGPSYQQMLTNQRTGNLNVHHHVFEFTRYSYYLNKWLNVFPREQILVLDGHAFEKRPAQELSKVETFLEIGSFFTDDMFVNNIHKGKPCIMTHENGTRHCLGKNKGRPHPHIPTDMLHKLKEHFHPMNERFFNLIGDRFDWDM